MTITSPTTINTTTGIQNIFYYLAEVTDFWFGRMLMIAIFIIFMFGYIRKNDGDWIGAFAVSSYVSFVVCLLFWTLGIVSGLDFAVMIGVTAVSSVLLLTQKRH